MSAAERSLKSLEEARFRENAARIAGRFREIADEIDRAVSQGANHVNAPEFGWRAQQIVHSVIWGLANTNIDALVLLAAEVDTADQRWAAVGVPLPENAAE